MLVVETGSDVVDRSGQRWAEKLATALVEDRHASECVVPVKLSATAAKNV
jgi:hypothetical protein